MVVGPAGKSPLSAVSVVEAELEYAPEHATTRLHLMEDNLVRGYRFIRKFATRNLVQVTPNLLNFSMERSGNG